MYYLIAGIVVGFGGSYEDQRLEKIEMEIQKFISDKDYEEALIKIQSLESEMNDYKWRKKREKWIKLIKELEEKNKKGKK